jgi:hypothetical protein
MACLDLLLLGRCMNFINSPAVLSSFHAVATQFFSPTILPPEAAHPLFKTTPKDGEKQVFLA